MRCMLLFITRNLMTNTHHNSNNSNSTRVKVTARAMLRFPVRAKAKHQVHNQSSQPSCLR